MREVTLHCIFHKLKYDIERLVPSELLLALLLLTYSGLPPKHTTFISLRLKRHGWIITYGNLLWSREHVIKHSMRASKDLGNLTCSEFVVNGAFNTQPQPSLFWIVNLKKNKISLTFIAILKSNYWYYLPL